jgi:hypothetical protein
MADITVRIGGETRTIADASESWITEQLNRRKRDGQSVCVEVLLSGSGVDLRLATPGCGQSSGGGGRQPNSNEQDIFSLWLERGLGSADFTGGNLIAFLKQLRKTFG